MKYFAAFFIAILLFTVSAHAQGKNIPAGGNPPLTQAMIDRLTALMQQFKT